MTCTRHSSVDVHQKVRRILVLYNPAENTPSALRASINRSESSPLEAERGHTLGPFSCHTTTSNTFALFQHPYIQSPCHSRLWSLTSPTAIATAAPEAAATTSDRPFQEQSHTQAQLPPVSASPETSPANCMEDTTIHWPAHGRLKGN